MKKEKRRKEKKVCRVSLRNQPEKDLIKKNKHYTRLLSPVKRRFWRI